MITDEQLVIDAQMGNIEAFAILTQRHNAYFTKCAIHFCREHYEDILHDAYLIGFYNISHLVDPRAFCFWMRQIIYHTANKYVEEIITARNNQEGYLLFFLQSHNVPENTLEKLEAINIFMESFMEMGAKCKESLYLYYVEEQTLEEIGKQLDLSVNAVHHRIKETCGRKLREIVARRVGEEVINELF